MSTGWQIGSLDVRDLRFNIQTVDGWESMPAARGADQVVAFKHGAFSVDRRYFEASSITLGVQILGTDSSGAVTHTEGPEAHIRENVDLLKAELYSNSLISIKQTVPLYPGAGTEVRERLGHISQAIPVRGGLGAIGRLMVCIFDTPSPFWRVGSQKTGESTPTVTNDGNAPVDDMVVTFTGGTNPLLTNTTTGEFIQITDAMATPVVVDVGLRTVTQSGSPADALLSVDPTFPHWMEFIPGSNSLSLTGGGSVSIDFYDKAF